MIKHQKYIVCTDSSRLPFTPATLSKKCCHWDWKFSSTIVPAHCGITGNELADQDAKQASQLSLITQSPIIVPEFLSSINSKILEEEEAWLHSFHARLLDLYDYKQPSKEIYLTFHLLSTCLLTKLAWPHPPTATNVEYMKTYVTSSSTVENMKKTGKYCCEKTFKAFKMCTVLGHHTSPPWAKRLSSKLLGRFVKTTDLIHSL